ncbi:hypothetical protein [Variovorax sp. 278MFTsu5.1]|uniref:hypothetical protein n=1 Tax=Variovorax sp. 278MFTsu5.1 TaxID=3158366 RepID=UPI003AAFC4A4
MKFAKLLSAFGGSYPLAYPFFELLPLGRGYTDPASLAKALGKAGSKKHRTASALLS